MSPKPSLYVLGGTDRIQLTSISRYDSSSRQWQPADQTMPYPLRCFGCTVFDERIYICGGDDDPVTPEARNDLHVWDPTNEGWKALKPMPSGNQGFGIVALDGDIYVSGGYNKLQGVKNTLERYSIAKDVWEELSPMIHHRHGHEMIQLGDCLYALGGWDRDQRSAAVERYDPRTDQWTEVASMTHGNQWFGAAVLNDRIYISGMYFAEMYDLRADRWQQITAPSESDWGQKLVIFEEKLLAIGGSALVEGSDFVGVSRVESYDFQKDVWVSELDMDVGRAFFGVAIV